MGCSTRRLKFVVITLHEFNGRLGGNFVNLPFYPGLTGFDSIALCKCKHVVRWIIST